MIEKLVLKDKFIEEYKKGYPLLTLSAVKSENKAKKIAEGSLVHLVDSKNQYIATAYIGIQNKGYGWVISKNIKETFSDEFFTRKLYLALEKRNTMFKHPKTSAFRVFSGESDGFGGITIDFYDEYYVLNVYSLGAISFINPLTKALLKVAIAKGIIIKTRFNESLLTEETRQIITDTQNLCPADTEELIVLENDASFKILLNDGNMTGLFLDQRDVRRHIRNNLSRGKSVLNLFSYSASFSVMAALGGAKSTTNVDVADRSHRLARENFELNRLPLDDHRFVTSDVFEFLDNDTLKYDLIIIDPPSFSITTKGSFSAKQDYETLIQKAASHLSRKGTLVCSTNHSGITLDSFKKTIENSLKKAKLTAEFSLPKDFRTHPFYPESNYLKVLIYTI